MKLRARTSVVGTITASLALALAGPALAANASAEASSAVTGAALARFPEFAGLKDSRSLSDPLMLQGKLTDPAGKALGGAQVLLAAWPSAEAVSKLPVGGAFDVIPVARTIAGKDGAYQLRSLITPLLMSLTGKDGLDVELDVFHGGRHYVYLTQLHTAGATWIHDFVSGVDGQAKDAASRAANALDLALDPATGDKLGKDLEKGARIQTSDHPIPGGVPCTRYKKINKDDERLEAWTTLVTAVARNGTTIKTKYAKGAKTVTSTGFSFDKGVSFSINGARERSANVEAKFIAQQAKRGQAITRAYEAQIEHDVLRRECIGNRQGEYRVQYMTSPAGLSGGFRVLEDKSRAPVGCNPKFTKELDGVHDISTENAKAYTYERSFGFFPLPAGGGFSGNSLSGYSEQVQVTFKFAGGMGAWCGHSAKPLEKGQIVEGFDR